MAQASASASLLADAPRAARLRFWIVIIGVVVIACIRGVIRLPIPGVPTRHRPPRPTASSATLRRRSPSRPRIPFGRPISCCATTVTWYETEHPESGSAASAKLAARAAGLSLVRVVSVMDEHGVPRFRSRELPATVASVSDGIFIVHRDHPGLGVVLSDPLITNSRASPGPGNVTAPSKSVTETRRHRAGRS